MTGTSANSWQGSLPTRGLVLCLAGLLLAWAYVPLFAFYAREHWQVANLQGAYAHAPLVLAVICYCAWRRREALKATSAGTVSWKGLLLLLGGCAARLYGDLQGYVVLQGMSLIPLLAGAILVVHGEGAWRALRFPVLMLLFVVPLPNAAIDALTRPLVAATTGLVVPLLGLFDIEVARTGHVLVVAARGATELHEIVIAPECSGVRSLVALMAVGSLLAYLKGHPVRRSLLLLGLIPVFTLAGNVARVVATVVLIVYVSPAAAEHFFHEASGVLVFVLASAGLLAVDGLLDRWARR